jgi:hypothetical protein
MMIPRNIHISSGDRQPHDPEQEIESIIWLEMLGFVGICGVAFALWGISLDE